MSTSILLVLISAAVIAITFTVYKISKKVPKSTLGARFGGRGKQRKR